MADDFGHKSIKTRRLVLRKIIMRKGVFLGFFPDNPQDKFYQSEKIQTPAELSDTKPKPSPAERKNNQRK